MPCALPGLGLSFRDDGSSRDRRTNNAADEDDRGSAAPALIESPDFRPLNALTEIRALLEDRVELEGSGTRQFTSGH